MALRLGALHDALLKPGDPDLALKAAEEVAAYEHLKADIADVRRDLTVVKWMITAMFTLLVGNLWLSFNILSRLPR